MAIAASELSMRKFEFEDEGCTADMQLSFCIRLGSENSHTRGVRKKAEVRPEPNEGGIRLERPVLASVCSARRAAAGRTSRA